MPWPEKPRLAHLGCFRMAEPVDEGHIFYPSDALKSEAPHGQQVMQHTVFIIVVELACASLAIGDAGLGSGRTRSGTGTG
jgi:hypothetical protein